MKRFFLALGLAFAVLATPAHAAQEYADLICETTTTGGTSTVTLGGAASNYLAFTGNITTGSTVNYTIEAADGKFEVGQGTYTDGGSDTLTRTPHYSSDGAATALNLSGTSTVCIGWGTASFEDGLADFDINSLTLTTPLAVTEGGTGQTTEAEALGEMTQALSENTTPDADADFLPLYDAGGDTGEKIGLDTLTEADVQTFTASGTWTKPAGKSANALVLIQVWGAGGSGGAEDSDDGGGGGGGGSFVYRWVLLSDMAATEAVTIGSGASGATSGSDGSAGGNSTVNTATYGDITAYGGGGGSGTAAIGSGGGGGGGFQGAGSTSSNEDGADGDGAYNLSSDGFDSYCSLGQPNVGGVGNVSHGTQACPGGGAGGAGGGGGVTDGAPGGPGNFGGGSGAGGECDADGTTPAVGGFSVWGGAGGGAADDNTASSFGAGGTSLFGGDGGNAGDNAVSCSAGTQPGGGGGGTSSATSCAGGDGQAVIYVY